VGYYHSVALSTPVCLFPHPAIVPIYDCVDTRPHAVAVGARFSVGFLLLFTAGPDAGRKCGRSLELRRGATFRFYGFNTLYPYVRL